MKLPGAERAEVEIAKLRDYCLSPSRPVGKHKARVFLTALGLGQGDAALLRGWLLEAAVREECVATAGDSFGQRYTLDFDVVHRSRDARVRSAWIVRVGEDFPRLVTCHVL